MIVKSTDGRRMRLNITGMLAGLLLSVILLAGCGAVLGPASGEGYILEVTDRTILVVDQKFENKKWNDIWESYNGRAISLKVSSGEWEVGQKVKYWIDGGVNESYPEQATAKKVELVKE